jgi:hypothetical protein
MHHFWYVNRQTPGAFNEPCKYCSTPILYQDHALKSKCGHYIHRFCQDLHNQYTAEIDHRNGKMQDKYDLPGCVLCEFPTIPRCFICRKAFLDGDQVVPGSHLLFYGHNDCVEKVLKGEIVLDNHHIFFIDKYVPNKDI